MAALIPPCAGSVPVPDAAHHGHGERPMDGATDNRQGGGLGRGERPWARDDAKTVGQNRGSGSISLGHSGETAMDVGRRRGRGDWIDFSCLSGETAIGATGSG